MKFAGTVLVFPPEPSPFAGIQHLDDVLLRYPFQTTYRQIAYLESNHVYVTYEIPELLCFQMFAVLNPLSSEQEVMVQFLTPERRWFNVMHTGESDAFRALVLSLASQAATRNAYAALMMAAPAGRRLDVAAADVSEAEEDDDDFAGRMEDVLGDGYLEDVVTELRPDITEAITPQVVFRGDEKGYWEQHLQPLFLSLNYSLRSILRQRDSPSAFEWVVLEMVHEEQGEEKVSSFKFYHHTKPGDFIKVHLRGASLAFADIVTCVACVRQIMTKKLPARHLIGLLTIKETILNYKGPDIKKAD